MTEAVTGSNMIALLHWFLRYSLQRKDRQYRQTDGQTEGNKNPCTS